MPDPREDLQATKASIRKDAEHLEQLEDEKSSLDPSDPRNVELSERVANVSAGLTDKAAAERALSKETQESR